MSTIRSGTRPPRSAQRMYCLVGADLFGPEHCKSAMEKLKKNIR